MLSFCLAAFMPGKVCDLVTCFYESSQCLPVGPLLASDMGPVTRRGFFFVGRSVCLSDARFLIMNSSWFQLRAVKGVLSLQGLMIEPGFVVHGQSCLCS